MLPFVLFGGKTDYQYDEVGNLIKEINANNKATNYEYDLLNRNTKETNALGNAWNFTYNANNKILTQSDPNGNLLTYSYDSVNQNTKITTKNPTETTTFAYDGVGNITNASRPNIAYQYSYDKLNQTTKVTDSRNLPISYSYDAKGNRTQIIYPDGKIEKYNYDKNDNLDSLTFQFNGDNKSSSSPANLATTFEYDANQNLVKQTNPNNSQTSQSFDNADRLTQVSNKVKNLNTGNYVDVLDYNYDLNKNGDKIKETIVGKLSLIENCIDDTDTTCDKNPFTDTSKQDDDILSLVKTYEYDPLQRLTKSTGMVYQAPNNQKPILSKGDLYSYDNVGNTTKDVQMTVSNGKTQTSTVDSKYNDINSLTSDTNYNYTYDKNGNQLTKKSKTNSDYYKFTYNGYNELSYSESNLNSGNKSASPIKNTDSVQTDDLRTTYINNIVYRFAYQYDAFGRRVSKENNTNYMSFCPEYKSYIPSTLIDCYDKYLSDHSPSENLKSAMSIPYLGIDKVNTVYDNKSYDSIADYYKRFSVSLPHNIPNPFYNVHTNYYLNNSKIIASDDIAQRQMPSLNCKLTGVEIYWPGSCGDKKYTNEIDEDTNKKPYNLEINNQNSNELVNYFNYDGLGSVVGRSGYTFSYKVTNNVVDPTPIVNSTKIKGVNIFSDYGTVSSFSTKELGDPLKNISSKLQERLYPFAIGFNTYNNKTYSGESYDIENGDYYYGSRYYDSKTKVWNKQDSYRGNVNDPRSRNRYEFVQSNPVNNRDKDGFVACGDSGFIGPCPTNFVNRNNQAFDQKRSEYTTTITSDTGQIAVHQGEVNRLNGILPGLQATMNRAFAAAYTAHVDYSNYIVLDSVVNRLQARGYDWDYAKVEEYTQTKIISTGIIYAVKQKQYNIASNNFYGATNIRDQHINFIVSLGKDISNMNYLLTDLNSLQSEMKTTYDNTVGLGKRLYYGQFVTTPNDLQQINDFNNENDLVSISNRYKMQFGDTSLFNNYYDYGLRSGSSTAEGERNAMLMKMDQERANFQKNYYSGFETFLMGAASNVIDTASFFSNVGAGVYNTISSISHNSPLKTNESSINGNYLSDYKNNLYDESGVDRNSLSYNAGGLSATLLMIFLPIKGGAAAEVKGAELVGKDLVTADNAYNIANASKLSNQLKMEEAASMFSTDGKLVSSAVNTSKQIMTGVELKNENVLNILLSKDANINNWGKYATDTFNSPLGPGQVHFYMNKVTGEIVYNIDYKFKF